MLNIIRRYLPLAPLLAVVLALMPAKAMAEKAPQAPRGAATPDALFAAFENTIATRQINSFMRVCSKELSSFSPGLSCGSLLNEAWHLNRKYSKLPPIRFSQDEKKSVIDISSAGDDNKIIKLFFLLEKTENNLWIIRTISSNSNYAEKYVK